MSEGYIPTALADEVSPSPRKIPDDWIGELAPLAIGQTVEFMRLQEFPRSTLTVAEDGNWTIDPPSPFAPPPSPPCER